MPSRPLTQLTLALLKPDLAANSAHVGKVFAHIQQNEFKVLAHKHLLWSKSQAEAFYGEHRGKFFFERLCGYMTSGHFYALILEKPNAITDWRALIGPTHPPRARINAPDTLRSLYGMTDTRNSFHGSDAAETAKNEIQFFFPEFDWEKWNQDQQRST
ncbi:nucleoside diphosphate kinase [Lobosporangium transversale]|uniref:Nucleoside diphosphate kinase n=1 Tax=Lobosporangium transversale TaxID=64571 RepID=A0A1Y2GMM0_9FUNG|nr:nucleoside diphosphate kinase [Lobosporangium transversale]ORZ15495.1 nucleoside diphosphate kinase [Lobosporangium transversale]|eukprot:XP_021881243.1 nucleoside diphosphate kinase [Lobosporangium transversale]